MLTVSKQFGRLADLRNRGENLKALSAILMLGFLVNYLLVSMVDYPASRIMPKQIHTSSQISEISNGNINVSTAPMLVLKKNKDGGSIQLPISNTELAKFGIESHTSKKLVTAHEKYTLSEGLAQWATLNHWVIRWRLPVDFSISTPFYDGIAQKEPIWKLSHYIKKTNPDIILKGYRGDRVIIVSSVIGSKLWNSFHTIIIPAEHLEYSLSWLVDTLLLLGSGISFLLFKRVDHNTKKIRKSIAEQEEMKLAKRVI